MTDHTRLRELAQNATPGPYRIASTMPGKTAVCADPDLTLVANRLTRPDAEFIAAANPAVVLDLIDRIATLNTQVSNQAAELEDTRAAYQLTRHQLDAHRAGQGTWVHEELGGHTELIHDTTEGITR